MTLGSNYRHRCSKWQHTRCPLPVQGATCCETRDVDKATGNVGEKEKYNNTSGNVLHPTLIISLRVGVYNITEPALIQACTGYKLSHYSQSAEARPLHHARTNIKPGKDLRDEARSQLIVRVCPHSTLLVLSPLQT